MTFLLSSTFTDSLARLAASEQKAVKMTVFDLQVNLESPGLSFHKLDRAKDKSFWSVRVSDDIRIIVHRSEASLLVCYVDHHDKAYAWAERRRLETHPKTGAAQLVEIRETVDEIRVPTYVGATTPAGTEPRPLERIADEILVAHGVPLDWLQTLRVATEDELLDIVEHLPSEAAEAVLELATGGRPSAHPSTDFLLEAAESEPAYGTIAPFLHPDARRRFRVMSSAEELERALDYPWEKWSVFLHPDQRELVERDQTGHCRVSGSAGTGKTVVALHRAVHLARKNPEARVLLATFSDPLAASLAIKLRALIEHEPRLGERIDVRSLSDVGLRLATTAKGRPRLSTYDDVRRVIEMAAPLSSDSRFSVQYLYSEWRDVVDAFGIEIKEAYRKVPRLGRKSHLTETQRDSLWLVFEKVRVELAGQGMMTESQLFFSLAHRFAQEGAPIYDFIVVDEAQDLSPAQLKFLAAMGRHRADALFFAGDLGQRIFRQPFSWKSLGVDVAGRCRTLRINYRTSQQIRQIADRLLDPQLSDSDGNIEKRGGAISILNGPPPTIQILDSEELEAGAVAAWIGSRIQEGLMAHEIGVFVRSPAEMGRAKMAIEAAHNEYRIIDEGSHLDPKAVSIGTMHLAKGLEFKAVVVMACDEGILPLESRIVELGDDADLEEAYVTERQLFYVACTRARDWLLVTGVNPGSEYLDDLQAN
jgi:mRNA-degrading endonuclease RelE of RelBE toxin-antitoxin system